METGLILTDKLEVQSAVLLTASLLSLCLGGERCVPGTTEAFVFVPCRGLGSNSQQQQKQKQTLPFLCQAKEITVLSAGWD